MKKKLTKMSQIKQKNMMNIGFYEDCLRANITANYVQLKYSIDKEPSYKALLKARRVAIKSEINKFYRITLPLIILFIVFISFNFHYLDMESTYLYICFCLEPNTCFFSILCTFIGPSTNGTISSLTEGVAESQTSL